jgi:hypothetical protein
MILLCAAKVPLAADGGRLKHVPEADRNRVNPLLVIARADALADYRLHQEPGAATPSAADTKPN